MVKINWTEVSIEDLKEIHEYIAEDSFRYAEITIIKIYKQAQILTDYPKSGKIVPEFNDKSIRELISGNYRIVYKITSKNQVDILRIYHSSRLLKKNQLK